MVKDEPEFDSDGLSPPVVDGGDIWLVVSVLCGDDVFSFTVVIVVKLGWAENEEMSVVDANDAWSVVPVLCGDDEEVSVFDANDGFAVPRLCGDDVVSLAVVIVVKLCWAEDVEVVTGVTMAVRSILDEEVVYKF